jgi:hypothetical protein
MDIREDLKAYVDGELNERRRQEVEAALARDSDLRRELDEIAAISQTLRTTPTFAVHGLEDTLVRLQRGKRMASRWVWGLAATAAAVAIGFAVIPGPRDDEAIAGSPATVAMASKNDVAQIPMAMGKDARRIQLQAAPKAPHPKSISSKSKRVSAAASSGKRPGEREYQRPSAVHSQPSAGSHNEPNKQIFDSKVADVTGTIKPPTDQEIIVEVASTSEAAEELQKLALEQGATVVPPSPEKTRAALESTKSTATNPDRREIVLEVPESTSRKFADAVRDLPARLKLKDFNANRNVNGNGRGNLGGAGGYGVGGAAGAPGGQGGASPGRGESPEQASGGASVAAESRFASKMATLPKMKRIRIVLVRKAPPE